MGSSIDRKPKNSEIERRKNHLKKVASTFVILTVAMVIFVSILSSVRIVKAQEEEGIYLIDSVVHNVGVMYNGYLFINDTVKLNITQAPTVFLFGFPEKYGSSVIRCVAYSGSVTYPVTLNVPLESRVGFYGVKIEFPNGAPETFTVIFVLSNNFIKQDVQNVTQFTLDFPAYPSLTRKVALCNATITLPFGSTYISGTVSGFTYKQENLQEFAYSPASLTFLADDSEIQIIDVNKLKREIRINEFGEIDGADTYEITNKASKQIASVSVYLPLNASNPSAEDQFGTRADEPKQIDVDKNRYRVNLTLQVENGRSSRIIVKYRLPSSYVEQEGNNKFNLTLPLFRYENYYVNQSSISFILPEGAKIMNLGNMIDSISSISRSVYQEAVSVNKQSVLPLDNFSIGIEYEYNPLWLSFRPTIWVWTLAIVGCAVVVIAWRQPKGPTRIAVPTAAVKVRPDYLKSFIDAYEEKMKINLEMETLEERVQKGKVPRRRYKVRTKMLETRLNTLSRTLADFKEKMRASGGKYAEMMLQLEVAESEIDEVGANIKNAEAQHNRGELSLEAHRKRLADYQHRKENAETTINGILLRLREETR